MSVWPQLECSGRKFGYARVSTKDQKLRMQRDDLESAGCDLIFEDHGISGANAHRPGLDDMLASLREGDMVVVFKLDRLGRSVLGLADLLVRFRNDGVHFCSICEGINTATPGGKLVYHIFSAVSEFGRDIIVENTIEGLNAARRRGARLGRPPKLDEEAILGAHRMHFVKGVPVAEMARRLDVSPVTLRRGFDRFELDQASI